MSRAKDLGRALEHRVAERARDRGLDAERHWGSGANPGLKGDGHIGPDEPGLRGASVLYEAKVRTAHINQRGAKQLTIPLTDLRKVQVDAEKAGYEAGIMVANAKGDSAPLAIMDLDYYLGLLSRLKGASPLVA